MTSIQIILSAKNGAEVLVMPIVPTGVKIPASTRNSESFPTANGDLTLTGAPKLREIEWESRFVKGKQYYTHPKALTDPYKYPEQIQKWIDAKIPIRIIITSDEGKSLMNMPCTIPPDGFSYWGLKNGDLGYQIKLTEYIFVQAKKV